MCNLSGELGALSPRIGCKSGIVKVFFFFSDFSVVFGFVIYYVRLFLKDPQNQFVHLYIYLYFFLVFLMSCSRQQSADSEAIHVFLKFLDCAQ